MTYRSLLVLLDHDPWCAARTRAAIRLARQFDAHLVGVAPTGLVDLPASVAAGAALADLATLAWDTARDLAAQAAHEFREQCRATGLVSYEAVVDAADHAPSLVRHAHCADLAILTQAEPGSPGHRHVQATVVATVLQCARPTLVLPYAGHAERIGSNVLVAWDDSRESARAVSDALPLLRGADRVQLVAWKEGRGGDLPTRPQLDEAQRWLRRHGVDAEVVVESTQMPIAEAILSHVADRGFDLVVMGAYGHARWTERVLGGATRGLLATMTVPVLMSR